MAQKNAKTPECANIKGHKKRGLTESQRDFMYALMRACNAAKGPVDIEQIVIELDKSDSRARSHIKRLMRAGYVRYVGKIKKNKYVPGSKWLEEPGINLWLCPHIGGMCQEPGCDNFSEVYWNDQYVCRDCMMGERDDPDGRKQYFESLTLRSSAGFCSGSDEDGTDN